MNHLLNSKGFTFKNVHSLYIKLHCHNSNIKLFLLTYCGQQTKIIINKVSTIKLLIYF